jgi:hypothetical protein
MPRVQSGVERSSWKVVAVRFALGLVGALINIFAGLGTIVGAIFQSVRDQDGGSPYAWIYHVGYAVLNGVLMGLLLAWLGDEDRRVLATGLVWGTCTVALLGAYWSWVL